MDEATLRPVIETAWWLLFWGAVGLTFGSFLNVVIYRIPREKSLRSPLWSACPWCGKRIYFRDNIPVLSYIRLGGRCRHCSVPIPVRYLVVEVTMAIIALVLLDAFFIGHVRVGLRSPVISLTDQLAYDWPILLAHILLFGCLLALSVIDLEHYWIDIRFTNIVAFAGFLLHMVWTPRHSMDWPRPGDTLSIMSMFAMAGLAVTWVVLICQPRVDPEDFGETQEEEPASPVPTPPASASLPPSLHAPSRQAGWIAGAVLIAIAVLMFLDGSHTYDLRFTGRGILVCVLLFGLIVSESVVVRDSDQAIVSAIEEERHESRRMVLEELLLFLPTVIAALVALWIMWSGGALADGLKTALHQPVSLDGRSVFRHWLPLYGLATAASGYVVAGMLGWTVRIGFTLVFGREAFGSGDIHMMAAAGAVAGWPVVVLGFFITCGLALLGWIVSFPFKRTRALPLGPWLALGFLVVVLFYQPIVSSPFVERATTVYHFLLENNSQPRVLGPRP